MLDSTEKKIAGELPLKDAYHDLIHPAASAIGQTISFPFRAVNVLLTPIAKWILQGEAKLEAVSHIVAKEVADVPEEKLVSPEPYVAVPAFQAISYSLDSDSLRNMYAKILATAMNVDTRFKAHPAYVEIIKQLSPLDCRVLQEIYLSKNPGMALCGIRFQTKSQMPWKELPSFRYKENGLDLFCDLAVLKVEGAGYEDISISIGNLKRLGLLDGGDSYGFSSSDHYMVFERNDDIVRIKSRLSDKFQNGDDDWEIALIKGIANITPLGRSFSEVCIGTPPNDSLYHFINF